MKKEIKLISIVLFLVFCLTLIIGCGSKQESKQTYPESWMVEEYFITPTQATNMEQLIEDWKNIGKPDDNVYINPNITDANFPTNKDNLPQTKRKMFLINFGEPMTAEQAIAEGAKYGLKQPTIQEGIIFATQNPDIQREKWIIVPHKPWQDSYGDLSVLYLDGFFYNRNLVFYCYSDEWLIFDWFLFASD